MLPHMDAPRSCHGCAVGRPWAFRWDLVASRMLALARYGSSALSNAGEE